jgi:hypothetical protein
MSDDSFDEEIVFRGSNIERFDVTQLPPLPRFVQKFSSFVTRDPPTAIYTSLCRIFDAKQVEYDVVDEKAFIFHAVYRDNTDFRECTFKVNFFANNSQRGETFVEFQRRTGCSLAFKQMYQSVTSVLGHPARSAVTQRSLSETIAPNLTRQDEAMQLDNKTLGHLFSSAVSQNPDEVRDSFRLLSSSTLYRPSNVALILAGFGSELRPTLTEVICASLSLHDEIASRHASAFLANLILHPNAGPLHAWLQKDCLGPLLALFAASSENPPNRIDENEHYTEPRFSALLNRETHRQVFA